MARTAVTGVPTSGTLVSERGTALTAQPLTAQPLTALGGLDGGRRSDHGRAVRDFWLDITAPPRQPIAVRGGLVTRGWTG